MKFYLLLLAKGMLILVVSTTTGLLFGILPCYLFPLFGAKERDWCGFKSAPPHFLLQFFVGFVIMLAISIYYFVRRR